MNRLFICVAVLHVYAADTAVTTQRETTNTELSNVECTDNTADGEICERLQSSKVQTCSEAADTTAAASPLPEQPPSDDSVEPSDRPMKLDGDISAIEESSGKIGSPSKQTEAKAGSVDNDSATATLPSDTSPETSTNAVSADCDNCATASEPNVSVNCTAESSALGSALMNELSLAVGSVCIRQPTASYDSFVVREVDELTEEDYGRLIEISGFPKGVITRDLLAIFRDFRDEDFDIRWVDDTHAVGIFSNQQNVDEVVAKFHHPFIKVCPFHAATAQTKQMVKKLRDALEPPRPRPETSTSTARNLLVGALGMRRANSDDRHELMKRSKESREKRQSSRKSKSRAWDGKLRPCAMDME